MTSCFRKLSLFTSLSLFFWSFEQEDHPMSAQYEQDRMMIFLEKRYKFGTDHNRTGSRSHGDR